MALSKIYHTCPIRSLEAERLFEALTIEQSDVLLLGSCVVTRFTEQMVIDSLNQHQGHVMLFGCISPKIRESIAHRTNVTLINTITFQKMMSGEAAAFQHLDETQPRYYLGEESLCNRQYQNIARLQHHWALRSLMKPKPIPYLVIANGCNCHCTYCHTRFYIGQLKSKPPDEVLHEYAELLKTKQRFVNIIAEDVGSYGIDIGSSLADLLNKLDAFTGNIKARWMIDGLQPAHCIQHHDALMPLIAKKRIQAISVPVQSGSSRILSLMNRPSEIEQSLAAIKQFRKANAKLYLQGVFIVGFPSETDSDFSDSILFIEQVGFNDVTLIPYSEFDICDSAKLPDKIPEELIYKRINTASAFLKRKGVKIL